MFQLSGFYSRWSDLESVGPSCRRNKLFLWGLESILAEALAPEGAIGLQVPS